MDKKNLNVRSLMTFFVAASFLACIITGIVIFITPQGRIANWVDWELLGLLKEDWANIHIVFSVLFIIAGIIHLYPYIITLLCTIYRFVLYLYTLNFLGKISSTTFYVNFISDFKTSS